MNRLLFTALLSFLFWQPAQADLQYDPGLRAKLTGFARLAADEFVPGPVSGQFIEKTNGRPVPFKQGQPVQGFSALLNNGDGSFLALVDNGYGARVNSPDFLLRVYRIRPEFKMAEGGAGTFRAEPFFTLHDPDRQVPFSIVADRESYPFGKQNIRVDPRIRAGRLLTGSDFDPESFQRLPDGTFWFGDEFGPWLLHTDATGRVLEPPVALPGVKGPDNPEPGSSEPLAARSGGFEGMALSPDGTLLHPMLEKPLKNGGGNLAIYTFDPASRRFLQDEQGTARQYYPLDQGATAIGDLTAFGTNGFLVIERDSGQGPTARIKRIYRVDFTDRDAQGVLRKRLVVDLMNLSDPDNLGGAGSGSFSFPFWTIESLAVLDARTIVVLNDNNYPFGLGRYPDQGQPDDSEMILLRLPDL